MYVVVVVVVVESLPWLFLLSSIPTPTPTPEPEPTPSQESQPDVTDATTPAAAEIAPDRRTPAPTSPEAELVAPIADQLAPKPEPKTDSAAMPEPAPPAPEAVMEADLPEQPSASAEPDPANDLPLDKEMKAAAEPEDVGALADLLDPMFDRMITPIGDAAVADDDLLSQAANRARHDPHVARSSRQQVRDHVGSRWNRKNSNNQGSKRIVV